LFKLSESFNAYISIDSSTRQDLWKHGEGGAPTTVIMDLRKKSIPYGGYDINAIEQS
jgi:hypothetical protein